jgi:hypothetical protein
LTIQWRLKLIRSTQIATVHKRVNFLICSGPALDRNTQKVRKARKLGIKIVNAEYLEACMSTGKQLPLTDYILEDIPTKESINKGSQETESKQIRSSPKKKSSSKKRTVGEFEKPEQKMLKATSTKKAKTMSI